MPEAGLGTPDARAQPGYMTILWAEYIPVPILEMRMVRLREVNRFA